LDQYALRRIRRQENSRDVRKNQHGNEHRHRSRHAKGRLTAPLVSEKGHGR